MTEDNAPVESEQRMVREVEVQPGAMAIEGVEGDQPVVMLRIKSVPLSDLRNIDAPVGDQTFMITAEFVAQVAELMVAAVPEQTPED